MNKNVITLTINSDLFMQLLQKMDKKNIPAVAPAPVKIPEILRETMPVKAIFENELYVCAYIKENKSLIIGARINVENTQLVARVEKKMKDFYPNREIKTLTYEVLLLLIEQGWSVVAQKTPSL